MRDERCPYCGTPESDDPGDRHYTATCREYVLTVEESLKREISELREAARRLRQQIESCNGTKYRVRCDEMDAENARLKASNERLREALKILSKAHCEVNPCFCCDETMHIAIEALGEES